MDEQRIYRRKNEMLQRDLDTLTIHKMQTYEQFRQNQFREAEQGGGFVAIEEQKDRFYSMDRVEENTLMIDRLLNNANQLQLSTAQREDLGIRRNRVKDFELLNNRTKEDSKEMRLLKEEIRNYDLLLSWTPHNIQECMQYCAMAQQKCEDAIKRCDDYLDKGKSLKFWKKNRNERYDMVKETKERYLRDKQRFTDLLEKPDMEQLMRNGDTMLDLMNYEAIKERHQQEQERQRQAEEEQRRREEDRRAGEEQAEGVNDLFAVAEKQVKEQQEQQQQQQQQQQRQQEQQQQQQQQQEQQQQQQQQQEVQNQQVQKFGQQELDAMGEPATAEMQAVRTAIIEIQTKMAQQMPKVTVSDDKAADQKAERRARKQVVDQFCAKMIQSFNKLDQSINKCLLNGDGYRNSKEIKGILTHLKEYTKRDLTLFKDRVVSYRSWLGDNPAEAQKEHTWRDAWQYVRAVDYDLDDKNNGLETKVTGAGASVITVITDTKKNQTVYFRKNEDAGGDDPQLFVKNFMDSIKEEIKCGENVEGALKKMFDSFLKDNEMDNEAKADYLSMDLQLYRLNQPSIGAIYHFVEKSDRCTKEIKDIFNDVQTTDETKLGMAKAIHLFARRFFQWDFSKFSAKIETNQSLTNRNVATSRLAAVLGISSMVSDSRTAVIQKDGKEIMGNVMEDSRGEEAKEAKLGKGEWSYSNKAVYQLFTLQVFDLLCGQIDRHMGNFHGRVKEKGGKKMVNSIKAIDNDMSFGLLNWDKIKTGFNRMSTLTECHIRSMPINVINNILALEPDVLKQLLGDLLEREYIEALEGRLKSLKENILGYAAKERNGLTINADGTASFDGEDADDELRMLKAVKTYREYYINEEDEHTEDMWDWRGDAADQGMFLIDWKHLTQDDLEKRIADRKKELHLVDNQQAGNQQA